jgi:hypothetical protein
MYRQQEVCLAQMSREVLSCLTALPQLEGKDAPASLYSFGFVARQPLPPDARLAVLSSLSARFLATSAASSNSS